MACPSLLARPRRSPSSRCRDPHLEERARGLLLPWAPALASSVRVGWNSRLRTTAGIAVLSSREVWLNPSLRALEPAETERTLRHELAHLLARHRHPHRHLEAHGAEWSQACRDLGIPGEQRTHRLPFRSRRQRRRFVLRCPACGFQHERVRRPGRPLACLACCRTHNNGRYDGRFRLLVLPKPDGETGS
jgi:SprT protein